MLFLNFNRKHKEPKVKLDQDTVMKIIESVVSQSVEFKRACESQDRRRSTLSLYLGHLFGLKISLNLEFRKRKWTKKQELQLERMVMAKRREVGLDIQMDIEDVIK